MELLKVTEKGISNWTKLATDDQYEAAAWLAEVISRNKILEQISRDAISVGAGPRESSAKGGSTRNLDEVVVVIDVSRKKTQSKCKNEMVPAYVQAKVPIEGRQLVLAIPTDVREMLRQPVAQADPFNVKARSQLGNPSVRGSICALVKNTSGNKSLRYVLTCHHVAFLSLHDPNLAPDMSTKCEHQRADLFDSEMGKSTRPSRFSPSIPFSIDAGLIRLDDDSKARSSGFWPVHPQGWTKKSHQIASAFRLGCHLYNRRLLRAKTEYSRLRFAFPVEYEGGGRAKFAQLIEYRLPNNFTRPGDSGGALISSGNILVGMHIAGAGKMGYAIPAYQLLRSIAFSPSTELAMPT